MQTLGLFVYDDLCLEDNFKRKFPNVKILSSKYAFTYGILRYNKQKYYFFSSKRLVKPIFGRYYVLQLEEEDVYSLESIYIMYKLKEINVTILKDVEDITTCRFNIHCKARASIFVGCYEPLRNRRSADVGNMSKYLLI